VSHTTQLHRCRCTPQLPARATPLQHCEPAHLSMPLHRTHERQHLRVAPVLGVAGCAAAAVGGGLRSCGRLCAAVRRGCLRPCAVGGTRAACCCVWGRGAIGGCVRLQLRRGRQVDVHICEHLQRGVHAHLTHGFPKYGWQADDLLAELRRVTSACGGGALTSWRAVASDLMAVLLRLPVGTKVGFLAAPRPAFSPCLAMSMTSGTVRVRT
jgi:hypothetical protein